MVGNVDSVMIWLNGNNRLWTRKVHLNYSKDSLNTMPISTTKITSFPPMLAFQSTKKTFISKLQFLLRKRRFWGLIGTESSRMTWTFYRQILQFVSKTHLNWTFVSPKDTILELMKFGKAVFHWLLNDFLTMKMQQVMFNFDWLYDSFVH